MTGSRLDEIVAHKRDEVAAAKHRVPASQLRATIGQLPPTRSLILALEQPGVRVIAEVKRRSPSAGEIARGVDPARQALVYETGGAAAISVLTDEQFFGGSLADLQAVRARVGLPVLRKDFVVDEYQLLEARAHGADAVLLIAGVLGRSELRSLLAAARELGLEALVEAHSRAELQDAIASGARLIGVNNRDLHTFEVDLSQTLRCAPDVPADRIVVSESGIDTVQHVELLSEVGVRCVLVGEALMRSPDPAVLLRELTSPRHHLWVKLCGLHTLDDARAALEAGADYLGFVFADGAHRRVELAHARSIVQELRDAERTGELPRARVVGVFVDESLADIRSVADEVGLDAVQLSGATERHDVATDRTLDVLRAVHLRPGREAQAIAALESWIYAGVPLYVLDAWHPQQAGGSGRSVDPLVAATIVGSRRVFLAGGLTPDTVGPAVTAVRPYGVDVSSGIERDGVNDPELMRAFVANARAAYATAMEALHV